jgi:hypothetical protein
MKKALLVATIATLISLCALSVASASSTLSLRSAKHALRVNLARGYGIHHVSAACTRRSRAKFRCRWRGRRGSRAYRGRAMVSRAGGTTVVQLTSVHRI